jgi:hypothetical protein
MARTPLDWLNHINDQRHSLSPKVTSLMFEIMRAQCAIEDDEDWLRCRYAKAKRDCLIDEMIDCAIADGWFHKRDREHAKQLYLASIESCSYIVGHAKLS